MFSLEQCKYLVIFLSGRASLYHKCIAPQSTTFPKFKSTELSDNARGKVLGTAKFFLLIGINFI